MKKVSIMSVFTILTTITPLNSRNINQALCSYTPTLMDGLSSDTIHICTLNISIGKS